MPRFSVPSEAMKRFAPGRPREAARRTRPVTRRTLQHQQSTGRQCAGIFDCTDARLRVECCAGENHYVSHGPGGTTSAAGAAVRFSSSSLLPPPGASSSEVFITFCNQAAEFLA